MNKALNPESPLHFLPKEFGEEKLMILDSLRFTLEMLDYSYEQLIQCLTSVSLNLENKIHFKIFHYAWTMIDHGQRFQKLYLTLNPPEESIIKDLNYLDKFRNAIQHVDLNLKKTNVKMIENGRPIYGALKWVVCNNETNETFASMLISGIFNINNIAFKQHEQGGYLNLINEIILETDTLKKKDENEINLCKLIRDISIITKNLDSNLIETINSNKLQTLDWKSRKDVLLNMKNE